MYTIKASSEDHGEFQVSWHADGTLTGPDLVLIEIQQMAKHRMVGCGGGPYWAGNDILTDGTALYLLMYELFDDVEVIGGDVPVPPNMDVPDGAVA